MTFARHATTLLVIGGLVLGGTAAAQTPLRGEAGPALHARSGPMLGGPMLGGAGALGLLRGLPIGTTVELRFHDADPADAATPVTTLQLTVGVDSEAAFADAFAAARAEAEAWEAAFLVVATGPQTRTVTKEDATDRPAAGRLPLALGLATDDGTVSVELYQGDPAAGGTLLETLSFTHGLDSAIGFRASLQEGWELADAAVVTIGPRDVTLDLHAAEARAGAMRERMGGRREAAAGVPSGMMERLREHLGERLGERFGMQPDGPGRGGRMTMPGRGR